MTVQITIVGLGQIGTSIGLALAGRQELIYRVGHDREIGIARQAEKMGALDKVVANLPAAVREADIVLLALPVDQIRDTLILIKEDLKSGAVVMDTSPTKQAVMNWAVELIPAERYYIGLMPAVNALYLHEAETGIDAAHADLFHNSLVGIVASPKTHSEAIKLAADLVKLLGAAPLFADLLEVDGLMVKTQILPQLIAAALLDITLEQPGWVEARKLAGKSYAQVTAPILIPTEARSLQAATMFNQMNVIRLLDELVASLQAMRVEIAGEDSGGFNRRLEHARYGREEWWNQRLADRWPENEPPAVNAPTASEVFGHLIGLRKRQPKDKK
jgi:prephenate dehydrogenase